MLDLQKGKKVIVGITDLSLSDQMYLFEIMALCFYRTPLDMIVLPECSCVCAMQY